jgi:hypothetical protein
MKEITEVQRQYTLKKSSDSYVIEDGVFFFNPQMYSGNMSEYDLRIIADELKRINDVFADAGSYHKQRSGSR